MVHIFVRKLVVSLPMSGAPTANKFTSTGAIFDLLDALEKCGTITVAGTQEALGCCERQARDYLTFLEGRGRIKRQRRGRTDEYHIAHTGDGGSLQLTQAVGTEFAVAALGSLRGTAFNAAAVEHVKTLRSGLRDSQGPRAERLRSAFYAVRGSVPTNDAHAVNAEEVLDAFMRGKAIRGRYERLRDGVVRAYTLRPVAIVVHHQGLHLLARKRDGKVHTFDIEGFRSVETTKRTTTPAAFATETYFAHAFGRYTDFEPVDVELRLRGVAARQVRRRAVHPSQTVESDDGDAMTARFRVGICPEFEAWLLGMAGEVEVVEPQELRHKLHNRHAEAARLNRAADQDAGG